MPPKDYSHGSGVCSEEGGWVVLCAPVQYMYMIHESVIEREEERERGEEILTNQNYDGATWNQEKKLSNYNSSKFGLERQRHE